MSAVILVVFACVCYMCIFQETVSTVKLDIHGDGVPVKVFDKLGDGTVGYNIYNIQKDAVDPQKLVYNKVGNYEGKLAVFSADDLVYPMPTLYESRCPNEQACAECLVDGGNVSDSSSDDDIRVVVLSCLLAAAAIAIVILAIITWRKSIPGKPDDDYLTPQHMYMMQRTETPGGIPTPHLGSTASSKIDIIPTTDN